MERILVGVTVGYMLKVLKSGKVTQEFKKEFDAIRHGDYLEFINLIGGPMPYIVRYEQGEIISGYLPPLDDDIEFELLLKAGPSLKIFLLKCYQTYGTIIDPDISDSMFESLALFEISLRIHAKNNKLTNAKDKLHFVIDSLKKHQNLSSSDAEKLHQGRTFLNMVKHDNGQYESWGEGISAFDMAFETMKKTKLGF